jgi:hypothetical protein
VVRLAGKTSWNPYFQDDKATISGMKFAFTFDGPIALIIDGSSGICEATACAFKSDTWRLKSS